MCYYFSQTIIVYSHSYSSQEKLLMLFLKKHYLENIYYKVTDVLPDFFQVIATLISI